MKRNPRFSLIGYVDMAMNLLFGFVALFVVLIIMPKNQQENTTSKSTIEVNATMMIRLSWQDAVDHDVDIWIKSENPKEILNYQVDQTKTMYLDRDDMGSNYDMIMVDGNYQSSKINQEYYFIKVPIENRYTVNLHFYNKSKNKDETNLPANCIVELIRLQPSFQVVHKVNMTLNVEGEQKTAFILYTDKTGGIKNLVTDVQEEFIYKTKGGSGPGAF
jgi:hypothetical protein